MLLLLLQISTKIHTYRKPRAGQLCLRESGRRTCIAGPAEIYALTFPLKHLILAAGASSYIFMILLWSASGSMGSIRAQYRWNSRAAQGAIGGRSNSSRVPYLPERLTSFRPWFATTTEGGSPPHKPTRGFRPSLSATPPFAWTKSISLHCHPGEDYRRRRLERRTRGALGAAFNSKRSDAFLETKLRTKKEMRYIVRRVPEMASVLLDALSN
jgi:hypothetical protein